MRASLLGVVVGDDAFDEPFDEIEEELEGAFLCCNDEREWWPGGGGCGNVGVEGRGRLGAEIEAGPGYLVNVSLLLGNVRGLGTIKSFVGFIALSRKGTKNATHLFTKNNIN